MSRNALKSVARLIDVANEQVPIEQQFLQDLQTSIEKEANQNTYIPSQTIKPSSFNCIRNAYFQLVGEQPENNKSTYQLTGICDSGTDRHLRIQKAITKMHDILGIDCEYIDVEEFIKQRNLTDLEVKEKKEIETKLYNKRYNMSFMTDGIIRYKGKYYIFEFKTETADKFYKRTYVDESHYNQAICYSLNFEIDNVLFVYENRNTLDLKSYIFRVNDEMRNQLVDKITVALCSAESKRVPPKPIDVLKKTCTYCAYRKKCEELGKEASYE